MNPNIFDRVKAFFIKPDQTKSGLLYFNALLQLGKDASPIDEADDVLGCVDSVEEIYKRTFGTYIQNPKTLSTRRLYLTLLDRPDKFQKIDVPVRGAIIISPTGYSTKGAQNGHVGICSDWDVVMSNDSRSGLWLENYTSRSWKQYYRDKLGFPVHFFLVK